MKYRRTVEDYLRDILIYAEKAEAFLAELATIADLEEDDRTALAVVRALEVIGEAAKQIPANLRNKYPDVPWRGMTGMRDKVIHDYFGVDLEVIWRTVKEELPPLRKQILAILEGLPK